MDAWIDPYATLCIISSTPGSYANNVVLPPFKAMPSPPSMVFGTAIKGKVFIIGNKNLSEVIDK